MRYLLDGGERLPESAATHLVEVGKSCWAAVTCTFLISLCLTQFSHVSLQKTTQTSPLRPCKMHEWKRTVFFKAVEIMTQTEMSTDKCLDERFHCLDGIGRQVS